METIAEVWKAVVGREGLFEVSDQGRVRSLPHGRRHWCGKLIPQPGRIVNQSPHSGGYRIVALRDGKKHYVHKLVMAAFIGEANRRDVNHIDGDKSNNCLANLEYCDRLHNVQHAIATGLQDNGGESNGMSKYKAESIKAAYDMVQNGSTQGEAARATGVSEPVVQQVVTGKRWQCLKLTGAT